MALKLTFRWLIVAAVVTLGLVAVKAPADDVAREREVDKLRQRAAQLQAEAEEHARAGKPDNAQRLAAEAKEVLARAQQAAAQHPAAQHPAAQGAATGKQGVDAMRQRVEQLKREIVELQGAALPEEAQRRMAEVQEILAAMRNRPLGPGQAPPHGPGHPKQSGHPEHQEIARRLHHLHVAAESLEAAGLSDQARQVRAQMEALERELHQRPSGPEVPPPIRELHERMEQMQNQINQLRELVEDLRRAVEKR